MLRTARMIIPLLSSLIVLCFVTGARAQERPEAPVPEKGIRYLSMDAAIALALQNNYDLLLAQEQIEESRGVAKSRLGGLLPNLAGTTDYHRLKTFQGVFGGGPVASTPRNIWDSRARMTQPLFSLSLIQQWQAGRVGVEVADLEAEVARRDTIATAAVLYLEALRAEAAVKARESNVELSRRLRTLTEGRKKAGAATGIDVIRAKTQVENERQLLYDARNERNRAKLNLVRAMGIPDGTPIVLTDKLELQQIEEQDVQKAVATALTRRAEIEAQARRLRFAELTLDSTVSERIPSLDLRGDYGLIGEEAGERVPSYSAGAFITWPFYDGQREGRVSETRSQLRQAEIQTRNLVHRVSIEARDAHQAIRLTRQQAVVAQEALALAEEQLRLSQRAFSIGTLTHLEIITAQIGVANARDSAIEAVFNFNAARVNLARALGQTRRIYSGGEVTVKRWGAPAAQHIVVQTAGRRKTGSSVTR